MCPCAAGHQYVAGIFFKVRRGPRTALRHAPRSRLRVILPPLATPLCRCGFVTGVLACIHFRRRPSRQALFLVTVVAGAHGLWLLPTLLAMFGGDSSTVPAIGRAKTIDAPPKEARSCEDWEAVARQPQRGETET